MTTDLDKANARVADMKAFNEKKLFSDCPHQGFLEDDIELRWQWQKGWLRAQLDEKDRQHPPTHKV